jgi:hypothetical protein
MLSRYSCHSALKSNAFQIGTFGMEVTARPVASRQSAKLFPLRASTSLAQHLATRSA